MSAILRRHSLMHTMALDKTDHQLTDSTVLQPALDYYLQHGTPDQRMRTRYYQGCINLDTGDDVRAMECFLDAIADTTAVYTDSLGLALVYIGQGLTYARQHRMHKFIELNKAASDIYKTLGDTLRMMRCTGRILSGYINIEDSIGEESALKTLESYLPPLPQVPESVIGPFVTAVVDCRSSSESAQLLKEVE